MFYSYNYFRQYNEEKEIVDHKEFYKHFSNTREFGGDFTNYDHLIKNRFHNTINLVYNTILRKQPKKVVDIGCGNGVNLPLSRIFPSIDWHAIDYAEKTVEKARETYPNIKFEIGDAFHLPYPNKKFDLAILSSVIILYKSLKDRVALLKEVKRTLDKDGVLVLVVWNDTFVIKSCLNLALRIGAIKKQNLPKDFMGIHFAKKDVQNMVNKAGFTIEEKIDTSSLFGALQCVQYLNMMKFNRNFGKSESKANQEMNQNIKADFLAEATGEGRSRYLAKLVYRLANIMPRQFCWTSIYVLKKNAATI